MPDRPQTTVVLAMSADGKIADRNRSPARFGSATDKTHLETCLAAADAALFGAATLRAYGTTLPIRSPDLLQQRQQQGKPDQPIHIVCSASAQINPNLPFFRQPIPRWLLTTPQGKGQAPDGFDRILASMSEQINWHRVLNDLHQLNIQHLVVMGGGELVAALLKANLIDELRLTICPLLLGGKTAPSPVAGEGFLANFAPQLQLLSAKTIDQEVFLHYRVLAK